MVACRRAVTEPVFPAPLFFLRLLLFMAAGAAGGWLFQWLGSPLPWMIGPLVVTALLCMSGLLPVVVPNAIRPFGQVVVASQIGLTFSPETAGMLWQLAPVILATAMMTLVCIIAVSLGLARWNRMTYAQSFLAAVPTSPVEAAAMTMARGVDPMPVIFSQTLRLSAVVLTGIVASTVILPPSHRHAMAIFP